MPYDNDFYKCYTDYLKEPRVRRAHDFALDALHEQGIGDFDRVVDLGCGNDQEYFKYYYR